MTPEQKAEWRRGLRHRAYNFMPLTRETPGLEWADDRVIEAMEAENASAATAYITVVQRAIRARTTAIMRQTTERKAG